MINHDIKAEVMEVRTESGVCPGMSKSRLGETHIFGVRTPQGEGICASASNAMQPISLAMRLTDKMDWEKQEHFDIMCPHGFVTFRISRAREAQ